MGPNERDRNDPIRSLRLTAFTLLSAAVLVGCAGNPYRYEPAPQTRPPEPPRQVPVEPAPRGPVITPPSVPSEPAPRAPAVQRSHPRYAPPPHVPAHWDNRLGVYVVEGAELYYRERLYYRWDGQWVCAARPEGPWEPVAPPSVPPGLRSRH